MPSRHSCGALFGYQDDYEPGYIAPTIMKSAQLLTNAYECQFNGGSGSDMGVAATGLCVDAR